MDRGPERKIAVDTCGNVAHSSGSTVLTLNKISTYKIHRHVIFDCIFISLIFGILKTCLLLYS